MSELVKGRRYYFDSTKQNSGVYIGDDHEGDPLFNNIMANVPVKPEDTVNFLGKHGFKEVKK